jgi:hypothetical protein
MVLKANTVGRAVRARFEEDTLRTLTEVQPLEASLRTALTPKQAAGRSQYRRLAFNATDELYRDRTSIGTTN